MINIKNIEQNKDIKMYCHNEEQQQEVIRLCSELNKKGYTYYLNQNFVENGVVITIEDNIQIEGEIIIFDNGNWIKDIYLKNISLYEHGHIEVSQELLQYKKYKITGALPLNI